MNEKREEEEGMKEGAEGSTRNRERGGGREGKEVLRMENRE